MPTCPQSVTIFRHFWQPVAETLPDRPRPSLQHRPHATPPPGILLVMSNPSVPSPSPASSGLPQGFGSSPRFAVGLLLAINLFNYIDRYVLAAV
ncbi:MAG: hypothetical protein ACK58T_39865, partial [Phycisphaerae bacterium]